MPFRVFMSPFEQLTRLPSFLAAELLFFGLAIALLVHAVRSGRAHVLIWVGALVAGTANDLIFMALPLVDNFWHAQATVMLTPRLPLYIPCVYVSFMYLPAVAVRRLRLPLVSTAALAGLVAVLFYAPFDITGAKLLWWTWHDTDLPVATRLLGAPASSTLWVLTFAASFTLLVEWVLRRDPGVAPATFAKGLLAVAGLSTVLMVLQITPLQQLDGGAPGLWALVAGVVLYAIAALLGARRAAPSPPSAHDRLPFAAVLVHYATLALCMALADPAAHVSTGVHQEIGPCYVEAQDITGLTRHRYLCARDFDEDFTFDGLELPPDGTEWYAIRGRPHTAFGAWMAGVLAPGLLGALVFGWLLVGPVRLTAARR